MVKKIVGLCLLGTGLLLLIIGLVMCGVSASFVSDLEDVSGLELSGSEARVIIDVGLRGLDKYIAGGFQMFALYSRGWFMWLGVLSCIAGLVLMALSHDMKIVDVAWDLVKRLGLGIAGSFKSLFAGKPKKVKGPVYQCPACGAPYGPGVAFCSGCGSKLPDPSKIGLCPACGTKNAPNARFCAGCGNGLQ